MARAIASDRPRRDVLIGLLDGEDLGEYYYGSTLLARTLSRRAWRAWRPDAVVVVDMVGKRGLRCFSEVNSMRGAPGLWGRMLHSAQATGLEDLVDGPTTAIRDDHIPFLQRRIPAILLIDHAYPAWHTTRDLPGECAPESLGRVGRLLLEMIRGTA